MAHSEFVFRNEEEQTAKDLYDKCRNSIPLLVIVNKGFYGIREELSFCTGQVLLLHRTQVQERALVYDRQGKTFSIPLDYCHYFTANDSTEEMPLRSIIIKHGVPVKIRFAESGVHTVENISLTHTLSVVAVHEEPFFLANTVSQGALMNSLITVPLYLKDVTFCQITDLVEKTRFSSLQAFMTSLTKQLDQVDFSMDYSDKEMVKLSDKTVAPSANIYPHIETNVYINIKQTSQQHPPSRPKSIAQTVEGQRGEMRPQLSGEQKEQFSMAQQANPPPRPARRPPPPVPEGEYTDASSHLVAKVDQQPTAGSNDSSVYEIPEPTKGQTCLTFAHDVKKPGSAQFQAGPNPPKEAPAIRISELEKAFAKRRDRTEDKGADTQIKAESLKVKKSSEIPLDEEAGVVPLSVRPVPRGNAVAEESAANVGVSLTGPAEGRGDHPSNKRTKAATDTPSAAGTKSSEAFHATSVVSVPSRTPLAMTPIKVEVVADPKDKQKLAKFGKSGSEDSEIRPKVLPKPKATQIPLSFEPLSVSSSTGLGASTSKTASEKTDNMYVNQREMALIRPTVNNSEKHAVERTHSAPTMTSPEAVEVSSGVATSEKAAGRQQNPMAEEKRSEGKPWPHALHQMTIAQVAEVLTKLNLGKYAAKFREEMVDGSVLSRLNDDALNKEFEMRLVEVARLRSFVDTGKIPV